MLLLTLLYHQGASHHRAQPRFQDGIERAAGPQLAAAIAPADGFRFRHGLRLADHVERRARRAGLDFPAGQEEAGRAAHLDGGRAGEGGKAGGRGAAGVPARRLVGEQEGERAALPNLLEKR